MLVRKIYAGHVFEFQAFFFSSCRVSPFLLGVFLQPSLELLCCLPCPSVRTDPLSSFPEKKNGTVCFSINVFIAHIFLSQLCRTEGEKFVNCLNCLYRLFHAPFSEKPLKNCFTTSVCVVSVYLPRRHTKCLYSVSGQ